MREILGVRKGLCASLETNLARCLAHDVTAVLQDSSHHRSVHVGCRINCVDRSPVPVLTDISLKCVRPEKQRHSRHTDRVLEDHSLPTKDLAAAIQRITRLGPPCPGLGRVRISNRTVHVGPWPLLIVHHRLVVCNMSPKQSDRAQSHQAQPRWSCRLHRSSSTARGSPPRDQRAR